jgi:hypothetical protein
MTARCVCSGSVNEASCLRSRPHHVSTYLPSRPATSARRPAARITLRATAQWSTCARASYAGTSAVATHHCRAMRQPTPSVPVIQ